MLRLKEFREDKDIKQKHIAAVLGITQQQYSLYEKEYRTLPVDLLVKICKAYNVSADYLLGLK